MSYTCGYTITDADGEEQPCDRPATGWRWYQGHEHEDMLDAACERHENEGGRRIHEAEAEIERVNAQRRAALVEAQKAQAALARVRDALDAALWADEIRAALEGAS